MPRDAVVELRPLRIREGRGVRSPGFPQTVSSSSAFSAAGEAVDSSSILKRI